MHPIVPHLLYFAAAIFLLHLWRSDLKRHLAGEPGESRPLPGAKPSTPALTVVGAGGALLLVAGETSGEFLLGIHLEQSAIIWYLLFTLAAAAVVEEVIFRGYLVIPNRGPVMLWGSILFFSSVFALLHPYLWSLQRPENTSIWNLAEARLTFHFTVKAWFSTGFIFLSSLWFYTLRFNRWNPERSLLPCFTAHLTTNLAVYAVKWAQGFVSF